MFEWAIWSKVFLLWWRKLSKKDKTFAKNYATLVKLRDKVEKDLKAKGIDIDDEGREILRKL